MILAWITEHATRLLVYSGLIAVLAGALELDGYRRGSAKLDQYQNDQLRATVKLVDRARKVDADEFNALQDDYNVLYADYIRLHADATRGGSNSLASAAASIHACPNPDGDNQGRGDSLPTVEGMLAAVEDAVLAHLETGDVEITKYRRLTSRDIRISNAVK